MTTGRQLLPDLLPNTRDLGGLRTKQGGVLRRGQLLRSASLAQLDQRAAEAIVDRIGLANYVDLRTDEEINRDGIPSALIKRGWQWRRAPIQDKAPGQHARTDQDLLERYQKALPLYIEAVRQIVALCGEAPILIACSLGKDRTGMAVALLLQQLDCNQDEIIADFVMSDSCIMAGRHLLPLRWRDIRRPRFSAAPSWVCAAVLREVERRYGKMVDSNRLCEILPMLFERSIEEVRGGVATV